MDMRGSRPIWWIAGLVAVTVIAYTVPWSGEWRESGPLVLFLVLALAALVGEVVALVRAPRDSVLDGLVEHARPADGAIGIVPMIGVLGEQNPSDPRFHRFVGLDPGVSLPGERPSATDPRSTPPLLGRIVLISVFVGRDGQAWSDVEIARAHAALVRAAAWIEREAIRWNKPVNLDIAETYFAVTDGEPDEVEIGFSPKGDDVQPFETHAVTKALRSASRAAQHLGFDDAVALTAEVSRRIEADTRVWLLHPRQAGHSLAVPLDDTPLAGVSLAVCYAREASFPEPLGSPPFTDPVTIVHELLHLFGATDKYAVPLRSFPPRSVTNREIMRLDENSLLRLRIDPLTAQEIGWCAAVPGGQTRT
jgi:hypothetical protein